MYSVRTLFLLHARQLQDPENYTPLMAIYLHTEKTALYGI